MDTRIKYRLYWRSKKNPKMEGEAREVYNERDAQALCREANRLFPRFQHWYE